MATSQRLALRDRFRRHLRELTDHRSDDALEWAATEQAGMHAEVNRARAERGLSPVDLAIIEKADRWAAGHIDWCTKFPLYCADIVIHGDVTRQ